MHAFGKNFEFVLRDVFVLTKPRGMYPSEAGQCAPDFGDTSPKQFFATQIFLHSRTPLRKHIQIRNFSASPKSPLAKSQNALFIGVSGDWYFAKC